VRAASYPHEVWSAELVENMQILFESLHVLVQDMQVLVENMRVAIAVGEGMRRIRFAHGDALDGALDGALNDCTVLRAAASAIDHKGSSRARAYDASQASDCTLPLVESSPQASASPNTSQSLRL
jgi:hypothetical protein